MVWSEACLLHEPKGEVWVGVTIEGTEVPERARVIRSAMEAAGAPVEESREHGDDVLDAVHDRGRGGIAGRGRRQIRVVGGLAGTGPHGHEQRRGRP